MPQQDHQQRPMETHGRQPEKLVLAEGKLALVADPETGIAEQRAEQQNFQGHPHHRSRARGGIVECCRLDPAERFLLAAGSGNAEGHRGRRPAHTRAPEHQPEKWRTRRMGQLPPPGHAPRRRRQPASRTQLSATTASTAYKRVHRLSLLSWPDAERPPGFVDSDQGQVFSGT